MKLSISAQNFTRTRIGAVAVAAGVAGAMLIGSGPAHATAIAPADSASADSLSITVHPDQLGNQLHPGFVGLSFGAATVAQDNYASTDLGGYLRTLGRTGVIRIGGNSGDTTFWTSTGETAPSWATSGTITPDKLHHLATIVRGAGWKVILAVNLKHPDPARAADEAKYARQIFGDSLLAIEIGNEPNFYYSSVAAYYTDFESYVAAIEQAAPGVGITGPDAETNHSSWLGGFAALEAGHPDVTEISDHTYPTSACGTSTATIPELLGTGSVQYETANAQAALSAAAATGRPGGDDRDQLDGLRGHPRGERRVRLGAVGTGLQPADRAAGHRQRRLHGRHERRRLRPVHPAVPDDRRPDRPADLLRHARDRARGHRPLRRAGQP